MYNLIIQFCLSLQTAAYQPQQLTQMIIVLSSRNGVLNSFENLFYTDVCLINYRKIQPSFIQLYQGNAEAV